ncbi:MAG: hypothetical protein IKX00_01110 [Bacilli bacterium]|nr:hypothetical protein [Bacilli bacterium]
MKKLFIIAIAIFMFPLIAYADGAGPEIVSYDAYVTNPKGAPYYDWDLKKKGTIEYEKKIRIYNEYTMDGEIYGVIEDKNSDDEYFVSVNDIAPAKKVLTKKDAKAIKNPFSIYVYKDIELYNGPAVIYGKNGDIIPKDSELTVKYADTKNINVFLYVEYNGKSGWIPYFGNPQDLELNYATKVSKEETLYIVNDIKYYKDLNNLSKSSGTIEKGTKITAKYYSTSLDLTEYYWTEAYLVEYKGEKVWILETDGVARKTTDYKANICATMYYDKCKINKDVTVYETPGDLQSKSKYTIKKGDNPEDYELLYSYSDTYLKKGYRVDWYYIKSDDIEGWVTDYDGQFVSYIPEQEIIIDDDDVDDDIDVDDDDDDIDDEDDDIEFEEDDEEQVKEAIITILSAVIVCGLAVLGITLLNKKKKDKTLDNNIDIQEEKIETVETIKEETTKPKKETKKTKKEGK